ncbi:hypothetical protein L7D48_08560 [Streptomyces sp. S1A]|nr:ribonuclease domain-containing protein [Streptomyces sp. ICN903]MCG3040616.1 hypothetical protein [Streptomyces sp. ICN903]
MGPAPRNDQETLDYIDAHGGVGPPGYGLPKWQGKMHPFGNKEGYLPSVDAQGNSISYYEYDVNPHTPGVNRGPERLVTGSDGSAYYTNDHYQNFHRMR